MSEVVELKKSSGKTSRVNPKKLPHSKHETFFYPKKMLYKKEELELLDSLYSDQPLGENEPLVELEADKSTLSRQQGTSLLKILSNNKTRWFTSGVVISSLVWVLCLQIGEKLFPDTNDTKIVFKTAATIVTDKNFDEEVSRNLGEKQLVLARVTEKHDSGFSFFPNFFAKKTYESTLNNKNGSAPEITENKTGEKEVSEIQTVTYYTIKDGDSLWLIAKEHYGTPSPENIEKIKEANKIASGNLYPGKKIIIPL